jgi:2-haloacid dehalogenase
MSDSTSAAAPLRVAIFDVNETLSDLSGLAPRFREAGLDPGLLPLWFATTLRDGFALTAAGGYADFGQIAVAALRTLIADSRAAAETDADAGADAHVDAAERIVAAMAELDLHADVAAGLRALRDRDVRIITLSNGSAQVAQSLLERAGLRDLVEACLSVSHAGRWKPHRDAYAYGVERCGVPAAEAALIAVHPWDIDGADRAGLRTGWLCRDGAPYPPFLRAPEAAAQTLGELAAKLIGVG